MTKDDFFDEMADTFSAMLATSKAKNRDYCGDEDPFKNFKTAETLGICRAEEAILVRMTDKMSRIANLIRTEPSGVAVLDEKITDTLVDLANYAVILKIYLNSKTEASDR